MTTVNEIEVTPEMLLAGSREMENYYLGDGRYRIQDDGLTAIYVAMNRAIKAVNSGVGYTEPPIVTVFREPS